MPDLKVVTLFESNLRDPAATLRVIADAIEAGEYGDVSCASLVLIGNTTEVFAMGKDSDATSAACLLYAGFTRLINAIEQHGKT